MRFNGRGESGQDNFAFAQNGFKLSGTFIDIGSNEPIRFNNTFALEEVGWRGWLFDIEPSYAEPSRKLRKSPFQAVDARTIDWKKVLGSNLHVDYLSLDIDENENRDLALTILQNLVASGVTWHCATIEHDGYRYGDNPRLKLREFMLAAGYKLAHADVEIRKGCGKPFEDWWIR